MRPVNTLQIWEVATRIVPDLSEFWEVFLFTLFPSPIGVNILLRALAFDCLASLLLCFILR